MRTSSATPEIRRWAALWGVAYLLQLCAGDLAPLWAQRRQAEPEANPQFQQDVQQPSQGGLIAPPAEGAAVQQPPGEGGEPARGAQNIQIGATAPENAAPPPPTNPLDTRIIVRVKGAPLATFLDTISAQARVNFIIMEGLEQKKITAFLQNVTVREALQVLLEMKGLTYQRIGRSNTYVVAPRAKGIPNRITRIYQLNYIPLVPIPGTFNAGQSQQQQQGLGGLQGAVPGAGGLTGGFGQQQPPGGAGGLGVNPADQQAGIAVIYVLKSVLTKLGTIALDARTNSIVITDVPEIFPQVEQILAELDRKTPQIMIEAQIVEINSDRAQQLGLEWGGPNGEIGRYIGPIRQTNVPLNLPHSLSNFHFFDPLTGINPPQQLQGGGAGGTPTTSTLSSALSSQVFPSVMTSGVLSLQDLQILLRALVTRSEARFLGKPKVLTVNNVGANIQISRNQADSITQNLASGGALTSASNTVQRDFTGLTLTVTPQVNKEGFITLLLKPLFTDVVESTLSSQQQPVFDPITRTAFTLVRVKNGQTVVLGGLLESKEIKQVRKVPLLGYIPLLGWLFTSITTQRHNTDLVIFITPTIVND